jgi:quercetin dioxygenase-like cupin family protein
MKNIDFETILDLADLVEYQPGQVVSRTLVQNKAVGITLFAFDSGEEISSHKSTGDALVYILDGNADIMVGSNKHQLTKGQSIVMPASVPHSLEAPERFKMLLTVIFPL